MACFFTDCSFKGIGELPKVLLVHQRCQWHRPVGASMVSMTPPAMHALPVSLTPAKTCFAGVNDTGEFGDIYCPLSMTPVTCFAGVIDTGKYMLRRCHQHRQMHASPVSMAPVINFWPVPVKLSKTVKVSLTGVVDTGEAPK